MAIESMTILWCVGGAVVASVVVVILLYNGLVTASQRVKNAWSQIDVQLKKRFDLVPNLVEIVKGYAKHEKEIFENVAKIRTSWAEATTVEGKIKASNMLASTLKSLFAVAENYPALQANQNFLALQQELSTIEEKVAYSRQFYNDMVMEYNTKIMQVPYNFIAGIFRFEPAPYYEVEESEKEAIKKAPQVKF